MHLFVEVKAEGPLAFPGTPPRSRGGVAPYEPASVTDSVRAAMREAERRCAELNAGRAATSEAHRLPPQAGGAVRAVAIKRIRVFIEGVPPDTDRTDTSRCLALRARTHGMGAHGEGQRAHEC